MYPVYPARCAGLLNCALSGLFRHALGLHQFLLVGTIAVVYLGHRRVLNRGDYNFSRFFAACWLEFSDRFVPAIVIRATANHYSPRYAGLARRDAGHGES